MLSDLWNNIIKYLTREELEILILQKIVSKKYICKICSLNRKLVIDTKIYFREEIYKHDLCSYVKKINECGLYINNKCSKCCHKMTNKQIQATRINFKDYKKVHYDHQNYWKNRFLKRQKNFNNMKRLKISSQI
tara:strand:+ start:428 stop:829 length:402 start_codon:yes stop_codon:yes gene_type:complete